MRDVAARGDFRDVFQDEDAMSAFRGGRSGGKNPGSACALFSLSLPLPLHDRRWGRRIGQTSQSLAQFREHRIFFSLSLGARPWRLQSLLQAAFAAFDRKALFKLASVRSNFRARLSQRVTVRSPHSDFNRPLKEEEGSLFVGVPVCATSGDGLPEPTFV